MGLLSGSASGGAAGASGSASGSLSDASGLDFALSLGPRGSVAADANTLLRNPALYLDYNNLAYILAVSPYILQSPTCSSACAAIDQRSWVLSMRNAAQRCGALPA